MNQKYSSSVHTRPFWPFLLYSQPPITIPLLSESQLGAVLLTSLTSHVLLRSYCAAASGWRTFQGKVKKCLIYKRQGFPWDLPIPVGRA